MVLWQICGEIKCFTEKNKCYNNINGNYFLIQEECQ